MALRELCHFTEKRFRLARKTRRTDEFETLECTQSQDNAVMVLSRVKLQLHVVQYVLSCSDVTRSVPTRANVAAQLRVDDS